MTQFTIPDMDCDGCIASITRAVTRQDAQAKVQADLATHAVAIQSHLDDDALAKLIDAAGYTVVRS